MNTIKTIFFTFFISIFLFSCALKPTDIKEEEKKYQATIHNVEKANYEFEERLNSFYQSEYIASKDLDKLYNGEYPDGVEEPTLLRIHWQKARELAIAEFELQKKVQTNWLNADVSERPILALDRNGGDYYRYYEYRILEENDKEVGAIRIPVYRRTENFSTSEVHVYSKDGKTYQMFPSMWGLHLSSNMEEDKTTDFYKQIKQYTDTVVTDGFAFNFLYFMYDELGFGNNVPEVPTKIAYDQLYDSYEKHADQMNGTRKSMSSKDRKLVIDAAARKDTYDYRDTLTKIKKLVFKLETIADLTEPTKEDLYNSVLDIASFEFFSGLTTISTKMMDNKSDTLITKTIKSIYWDIVDDKDERTIKKYLVERKWNIYKELDRKEVKPLIEYPEYYKYPQREKDPNLKYKFQEYSLVENIDEHSKLTASASGFISKDGFKSSLYTQLKNPDGNEFSREFYEDTVDVKFSLKNIVYSKTTRDVGMDSITNREDVIALKALGYLKADAAVKTAYNATIEPWRQKCPIGHSVPAVIAAGIAWFPMQIAYKVKGRHLAIAEKLDEILSNIDKELGKDGLNAFVKYLDTLKNQKPFTDTIGGRELRDILEVSKTIANNYIAYGPGSVKKAFLTVYDYWLVWYVPFLPFPTGAWIVDKGNGKYEPMKDNDYAYFMSIPMDFDLSNIVLPEKNPTDVTTLEAPAKSLNPKLAMVPDKLKPHGWEWLAVNDWLTYNKLYDYDINTNHKTFKHLTQENVQDIYYSFVDTVYDIYEGITPVYIDKSKPYTEATNVTISGITTNITGGMRPITNYTTNYNENIVYNIIDNPTKNDKDEQNKFNINSLKDIMNTNYNITLGTY